MLPRDLKRKLKQNIEKYETKVAKKKRIDGGERNEILKVSDSPFLSII